MKQLVVILLGMIFPKTLYKKQFKIFNHTYTVIKKTKKGFLLQGSDTQNPKYLHLLDLAYVITPRKTTRKNLNRLVGIYNKVNRVEGHMAVLRDNYISAGVYAHPWKPLPLQITLAPEVSYDSSSLGGVIAFQELDSFEEHPLHSIVHLINVNRVADLWIAKANTQFLNLVKSHLGDSIEMRTNKSGEVIATGNGKYLWVKPNDVNLQDACIHFTLGPMISDRYAHYLVNGYKKRLYVGKPEKILDATIFVNQLFGKFHEVFDAKAEKWIKDIRKIDEKIGQLP
jgi:hypothetical protein